MSQDDMAVAVGKTGGAAWQWENGRTTPRRAVAMKLDQLLGADGEILAAFGYATAVDDELISRLDERYVRMETAERALPQLARVVDDLAKLQKRVARLEAKAKPQRRSSQASG